MAIKRPLTTPFDNGTQMHGERAARLQTRGRCQVPTARRLEFPQVHRRLHAVIDLNRDRRDCAVNRVQGRRDAGL